MRFEMNVEKKGPIFRPDGPAALRRATESAVREIVDIGMGDLLQQLTPRPRGVFKSTFYAMANNYSHTGNYRRRITPKVDSLNAKITDNGVVYGPWLEGTSTRNNARFPGYATFRKVSQSLEKKAKRILAKHLRHYVNRMNG